MEGRTLSVGLKVLLAITLTLLAISSWASEKKLHNFNGTDGSRPLYTGLVFDASGNLFGTTSRNGLYNGGTVYELSPNGNGGWTEKVLYNFDGRYRSTDGNSPEAGVIFGPDGNLYGTASGGGSYGGGIVFELVSNGHGGWTEKKLHNFGNGTDGSQPYSALIFDSDGNMYGTTMRGGNNESSGTVFEMSPNGNGGWSEKKLHNFNPEVGHDGEFPQGQLVFDNDGNLFGTTPSGGAHQLGIDTCGMIFELSPNGDGGWTETKLHYFGAGTDGCLAYGGLVRDAEGNFYGTTLWGGSDPSSFGTAYELSPNGHGGWTETKLHNFGSGNDGAEPWSNLTFDGSGNLYGTTGGGGSYGAGTVFELSPNGHGGWSETRLHNFDGRYGSTDGKLPQGSLVFDASGNLYGTTELGGSYLCGVYGCGTVFEVEP
ncbi:MAG: choice-of-anchor tandem repeat GloVer-containing protein [Candidatus Korobacteraceae bacterium]